MRTIVKQVLLTKQESEAVEKMAEANGTTVSSMIRELVLPHLSGMYPLVWNMTKYIMAKLPDSEWLIENDQIIISDKLFSIKYDIPSMSIVGSNFQKENDETKFSFNIEVVELFIYELYKKQDVQNKV